MRVLKKAIAGLMLLIGVPVFVLTTLDLLNPQSSQEEKTNATAALIILGLPPMAIGAWLTGGLYTDARRQERDRLRTTFFNLVKQGQGTVSAFDFAEATGLSGERARLYLDDRARTFNATFHVDDAGGLFYVFTLGYANAQRLLDNATPHPLEYQAAEELKQHLDEQRVSTESSSGAIAPCPAEEVTYDLLLKNAVDDCQADIQQLIQALTHHDEVAAADLINQPMSVIATGLNRTTAEQYRHQLEAAGAEILVVLPPTATPLHLQDAPALADPVAESTLPNNES